MGWETTCTLVTMCGRYAQSRGARAIAAELAVQQVLVDVRASWNVAPTQDVPVVLERVQDDGPVRQLRALRWGLVTSWAKDPAIGIRMINARIEIVLDKPAFRRAVAARRAVVPYARAQATDAWPIPSRLHVRCRECGSG